MKPRIGRLLLYSAALSTAFVAGTRSHAEEFGRIEISHPWVETAAVGSNTRLRMTITNGRYDDIHIVRLTTPAAARTEIQFATAPDKFRAIDVIAVPSGQRVGLNAQNFWVSLIDLKQDLDVGDEFPVTLHFARGQRLTVLVQVGRKQLIRAF